MGESRDGSVQNLSIMMCWEGEECREGSIGMGVLGWEHRDLSMGTGEWE